MPSRRQRKWRDGASRRTVWAYEHECARMRPPGCGRDGPRGAAIRVRRMRQDRRHVGAPANVSGVRRHPLLRQLTQPSRDATRAGDWASGGRFRGAGRTLAVLLPGQHVREILTTSAAGRNAMVPPGSTRSNASAMACRSWARSPVGSRMWTTRVLAQPVSQTSAVKPITTRSVECRHPEKRLPRAGCRMRFILSVFARPSRRGSGAPHPHPHPIGSPAA